MRFVTKLYILIFISIILLVINYYTALYFLNYLIADLKELNIIITILD